MSADREWNHSVYGGFADELYAAIRQAAFGEDIGQNSWLTADELRTFCEWLGVDTSTELLEVASGSGGPALFTVETTGCRLFGVDLHDEGVAAANRAAQERGLADRARFVCVDARKTLPVRRRLVRRGDLHRLDQPHVRAERCAARVAPRSPSERTRPVHRSDHGHRAPPQGGDDPPWWCDGRVRLHARPATTRRCCSAAGFDDIQVEGQ